MAKGKAKSPAGTGSPDSDEMVLTPGGLRPKSTIHQVEPGYHISAKDGRLQKIHTATGQVVADYGEISHETPGKRPVKGPSGKRSPES
jgi:hypothetical protein